MPGPAGRRLATLPTVPAARLPMPQIINAEQRHHHQADDERNDPRRAGADFGRDGSDGGSQQERSLER